MIALRFTETMKGYAAMGEADPGRGFVEGGRRGTALGLRLTLSTHDLGGFIRSRQRLLEVEGELWYAPMGGRRPITGSVGQLVDVGRDPSVKSMPYALAFTNAAGSPFSLSAMKGVVDNAGFDVWRDTTTLTVRVAEDPGGKVVAAGVVRIGLLAFLGQFPTYRISGGSFAERLLAFPCFYGSFLAKLWEVYGPRGRGGRR